jgi:uncharacterized transporter YbjL
MAAYYNHLLNLGNYAGFMILGLILGGIRLSRFTVHSNC